MSSRGQVQVEVVADVSKFPAQVERELTSALRGIRLSQIPIDADTAPLIRKIKEAQAEVDKSFSGMWARLKAQAAKAGAGIGAAFAASIAAALVSGIGPAVAGVIAILSTLAPAVVAAVPAAVGALLTMKVALFGVGDALKEVGSDQAKFDEAIEGLSPNAKKFAQALRSVLPQLTAMKNAVQDRFFRGLDSDLKAVTKNLVGPTTSGMTAVSGTLNRMARDVGAFGKSAKGAEVVNTIFEVTNVVLTKVANAFGPLLDRVGDWIIKAGDSGVNSKLAEVSETLGHLWGAAKNVGASLGLIFGGGSVEQDGLDVAASLEKATGAVKDFLAAPENQELLTTLRDTMDLVSKNGQTLLEILPVLTPALAALAGGGFTVLAGAVAGLIVAITPLAEFLGGQTEAMYALGAAIGVVVVGMRVYQGILAVVTVAQIAWKAAVIATNIVMTVATVIWNGARLAVALMGIAFTTAGAQATILATALWGQVTAMTAAVVGWVRTGAAAVVSGAQQLASLTATNIAWGILVVRSWAAVAATTAVAVAQRAVAIATNAWTAAQWLLNAAMTANPIGIVIAIIVALVAAIVIAYQKSETFRSIVDAAFRAVGAAAIWLWDNALKPLWDGLVAAFNFVAAAAGMWWAALQVNFQLVAAGATALWNWIKSAWDGIVAAFNFVVAGAASFYARVNDFFGRLKAGAAEKISSLISTVTSIPGRITGAIGNLGSILYGAGSSVINGLINGIRSGIDRVKGILGEVTGLIPDWKGPEDVDRRLLRPAGRAIMEGLRYGIGEGEAPLRQQLSGVTQAIGAAPVGGWAAAARGGDGAAMESGGVRVWPSQRSGTPVTLVIESDGTRQSQLLVETISEAVRVRGGNVQKVLGKTGGGVR